MSQVHETPAPPAKQGTEPATRAPVNDESRPLRRSVEIAVGNYFAQLDGQMVTDVYDMVLQEVEAPLLEAVLKYTRNNQTLASSVLGLNRGTLRKKLKRYGLL
jgi:Fis family transcriptional regulator